MACSRLCVQRLLSNNGCYRNISRLFVQRLLASNGYYRNIYPVCYKSTKTNVTTDKMVKDEEKEQVEVSTQNSDTEDNEHIKIMNYVTSVPLFTTDSEEVKSHIKAEGQFKSLVESMSIRIIPSVSTVIKNTQSPQSEFFLNRWKGKMIEELGEEGFKNYQQDTFRQGTNFHANVQEFLSGKSLDDIQIDPANEGHWRSLQKVFPLIKNIAAIETQILHPTLFYKGVFDCVAVYKDSLCVIDWKTSKQPKPLLSNTYDSPLQVAAYMGAINSSQVLADKGIDNVKTGVLVIAYPQGYPAHVHFMDQKTCTEYWNKWLERLQLYWKKTADKKLGLNLVKDDNSEYTEMF